MNNRKATKRALLTSVMALAMCVVMLIGTTFAWFTDTATANVNTIKSGTLDVALYYGDTAVAKDETRWTKLEDNSPALNFLKADGTTVAQSADILWEPGCTYSLPVLKIVNEGSLALKFKVQITGIEQNRTAVPGQPDLNDVIDWTVAYGSGANVVAGSTDEYFLLPANSNGAILTISGHMQESAGNDYQDLTIDGAVITVYATQYTSEFDSSTDQYDKDATYYPVLNAAGLKDALVNGGNIQLDADVTADATMVANKTTTIDMNGKTIANTSSVWDTAAKNWSLVSVRNGADLTITGNGTFDAMEDDCYAVDVQNGSTVTIENGTFIGNTHAVYVRYGTAYIKGGFFSIQGKYPDPNKADEFVLNCYDAARRDENGEHAKIIVTGGTFVNFNPADCKAEGEHTNFVADGYSVVSETQPNGDIWYTVIEKPSTGGTYYDTLDEAISAASSTDGTITLGKNSTVTISSGIANEGSKARNVTFEGDGSQTVDVITEAVNAEGGMLSYQRGSTFTFKNVTVQAGEGSFDGIVCNELVYENCTIKGKLTLYGKATFINCTFDNTMANQYSIWTWGGTDVKFENCTFNTNGKAILLYGQATAAKPTNLAVTNCVFNDRNNGAAGKAAIEIGNDYDATYTLTMNDITVNGFAAGKNTGSTLWANKNSMDAAHLTVTIDGVKAY